MSHLSLPHLLFYYDRSRMDADLQEFFWSFPDLEPLYNAARSYLEISQRVDLLNARVDVSLLYSISSLDHQRRHTGRD